MFEALINECRARFAQFGWRKSIFRGKVRDVGKAFRAEGLREKDWKRYIVLAEQGRVVWAAYTQANEGLFAAGKKDLPGNTVFSVDEYFDSRPHHVVRINGKVASLKGTEPTDIVLGKVAAIITDEKNGVSNYRLPWKLSDGHVVYLSSTMFHRCSIPGGILSGGLFPLVVAPDLIESNMVLPLSCWPDELQRNWSSIHKAADSAKLYAKKINQEQLDCDESDALNHPHHVVTADDVVPGASKSVVSLTPRCAQTIRDTAKENKLRGKWWLKIGGHDGNWTLDVTVNDDLKKYLCVESQGVQILVPRDRPQIYAGLVIDYAQTAIGKGFIFHPSGG